MMVGVQQISNPSVSRLDVSKGHAESRLPQPLCFRSTEMPANATYARHRHPWGELVYSYRGLMEISLNDAQILAPSRYAIWIPPDIEHWGLNRQAAVHFSLYVSPELCCGMPDEATALEVTPLAKAMLEHLKAGIDNKMGTEEHLRFLAVLIDQMRVAVRTGTYLPWSTDQRLAKILISLSDNPSDNRSLAEHARLVGTTERTLIRRCIRDLNMPFAEWKQRLRVTKAVPMLEEGHTVGAVALALGYSNASSFIVMFKKMTGATPDEYRTSATVK